MDSFLKTKPNLSLAHRVRTVIQNYYLFKRGAYEIKDGKIHVNIDKVVPAAYEMLSELLEFNLMMNLPREKNMFWIILFGLMKWN